jgi:hypothetical protein
VFLVLLNLGSSGGVANFQFMVAERGKRAFSSPPPPSFLPNDLIMMIVVLCHFALRASVSLSFRGRWKHGAQFSYLAGGLFACRSKKKPGFVSNSAAQMGMVQLFSRWLVIYSLHVTLVFLENRARFIKAATKLADRPPARSLALQSNKRHRRRAKGNKLCCCCCC